MAAEAKSTEHKIDPNKIHWKDFYTQYKAYITIDEIRKNRKLAVLSIQHKNKNAPFVFLIHGACARMGQFKSLIEHLSNNFNIIAFDRIGCGYSNKPKEATQYKGAEIFFDLCALFEKYIPQQKNILIIAHSFGCSQATRLYAKYGNYSVYKYNIQSIILLAAHPFILGENIPITIKGVMSLPNFALNYMGASMSATFREKAIYSKSKKVLDEELTYANINPPFMYSSFYLGIIPCSDNEFKIFCKNGVNVMVIHGKYDQMVTLENSQNVVKKFKDLLDKKYLLQFEIIDNCSHQIMQEQPDIVHKFVDGFWTKSIRLNYNKDGNIDESKEDIDQQ
eukprot:224372_1